MINVRQRQLSLVIIALSFLWLSPLLYRPWNRSRLVDVCGFVATLSCGIFRFIASGRYRPPKKTWTPQEASDRIKALTKMLASQSHDRAELLHQRAMLQISQQEWEAAVDDFTDALDYGQDKPTGAHSQIEGYHYRGVALVRLERFKEAILDLTVALAADAAYKAVLHGRRATINPGETLAERADCYLAEGDDESAENDLRNAIPKLQGEYLTSCRIQLGSLLERKSQWQNALEEYEIALKPLTADEDLPERARIQYGRGRALYALERFEETLQTLDEAISLMCTVEGFSDELIDARLMRANTFMHRGEWTNAVLDIETVLQTTPGELRARVSRAIIAAENQQFQSSVDELADVLRLEPDYLPALQNYAVLLTGAHDDTLRNGVKALELAEKLASQMGRQHWYPLSVQAAAHAELGDFQKAIELAQQSLEAAPQEEKVRRSRRLEQFRQHRPFRCEKLTDQN